MFCKLFVAKFAKIILFVIGVFKGNNTTNAFLLFFYGVFVKLPFFLHPHLPLVSANDGFFYTRFIEYLSDTGKSFPVIYPLICFFLLLSQALTLNKLINDQRLMYKPNYLVALAYLLLTSIIPEWNYLSPVLIINSVMVWAWPRMVALYSAKNPKALLFNIGLGFGLCSFFYFPALVLLILFIGALILFRSFNITEWLVALLGVLTPYYFLFVYLFLTDKLNFTTIFPGINMGWPHIKFDIYAYAEIFFVTVPLFAGMYQIQKNLTRMLIQVRKSWALMNVYLFITLFIPFINFAGGFEYWILAVVPLAAFHASAYLYPKKNGFGLSLHWSMVIFIVVRYFVLNKF